MLSDETRLADPGQVMVQLLDRVQEHPIQIWKFDSRNRITIGRAVENDVYISDKHVSRLHAEICFEEGVWFMRTHGRNGVYVDGESITETELPDYMQFTLGHPGPAFCFFQKAPVHETPDTVCMDSSETPKFQIDLDETLEQVEKIVNDDYFRELQRKCKNLRPATV